mgnify:CR=1 FL=1
MKNTSLSEKLIVLKEKIVERTSEIDKSKGKLSMLQDNLKKIGFKNIEQAKEGLKKVQIDLQEKIKSFNLQVKNLEKRIENEDN